jgi:hypothetical protein
MGNSYWPIACVSDHDPVVKGVIGGGMIEDRFLRSRTGIGRIKEGRDRLKQACTGSAEAPRTLKKESAKNECCKNVPERSCHNIPLHLEKPAFKYIKVQA